MLSGRLRRRADDPDGAAAADLPAVTLTAARRRAAANGGNAGRDDIEDRRRGRTSEGPRFRLLDPIRATLGWDRGAPGGLLHPVVVLV